ncbi:MAG: hypothetical protein AAFV29_16900, partial [Myxococcota bacterium]
MSKVEDSNEDTGHAVMNSASTGWTSANTNKLNAPPSPKEKNEPSFTFNEFINEKNVPLEKDAAKPKKVNVEVLDDQPIDSQNTLVRSNSASSLTDIVGPNDDQTEYGNRSKYQNWLLAASIIDLPTDQATALAQKYQSRTIFMLDSYKVKYSRKDLDGTGVPQFDNALRQKLKEKVDINPERCNCWSAAIHSRVLREDITPRAALEVMADISKKKGPVKGALFSHRGSTNLENVANQIKITKGQATTEMLDKIKLSEGQLIVLGKADTYVENDVRKGVFGPRPNVGDLAFGHVAYVDSKGHVRDLFDKDAHRKFDKNYPKNNGFHRVGTHVPARPLSAMVKDALAFTGPDVPWMLTIINKDWVESYKSVDQEKLVPKPPKPPKVPVNKNKSTKTKKARKQPLSLGQKSKKNQKTNSVASSASTQPMKSAQNTPPQLGQAVLQNQASIQNQSIDQSA